ncbi:MAG: hypothetical protein PWP46_1651 [Fusobacteriaceae bacterium]|jgi:NADH-quinone oxidoreductase subunit G|nr:NAD(P)-dependent iron-only hydrogenase catalytic subunit [Fusobacteriales bacterium]MDN5304765.1 hypothetical protein [Fusobacteriaceae bacterium]
MVKLRVNNEEIEIDENSTILDAAKQLGYKIPTLCYKKNLSVYGGCRICVVEDKKTGNLVISCATKVENGMEILTNSEKVRETRKGIFELILANHPFDCNLNCLTCSKNENCELQTLAKEIGITKLSYIPVEKDWEIDDTSLSIFRENSKCISCTRCIRTCKEIQHVGVLTLTERGPFTQVSTFMNKGMGNINCTNCGQCILSCPTGAIREVYHINEVLSVLNDNKKHVVVQTAPSVRIGLAEEFGYPPGTNVEGKMVTALRKMGFDKVFDTNFTADLTILEEGSEFIERFTKNENLPLITSCSPGWVKFAEDNMHDIIDNLSSCKSPQQMFGALAKSYYAKKSKIPKENIVSVSIMPCTAKKYEMNREEMKGDVDYVLTIREFANIIKAMGIDFRNLPDSQYDEPFGISTGAGVIFGASGGVMEAALRTAYELITGKELENIEFNDVRGLNGIKEAEIKIADKTVRVAVANGLENAYKLLQNKDKYHFIEIMACPGGCIGGGGEPFSCDDDIVEKRMKGIYAVDKTRKYRKSHENPAIKELYNEFLEKPLSEVSHKYLHTHYKKREYN